MKTVIIEKSSVFHEYLTVDQAAGIKYAFRTDCRLYCLRIIATLLPWILSWKESSGYQHDDSYVDVDGVIWSSQNWGMDTEIQLIIKPDGPGLEEIRWLLNNIVNSYVAAESINFLEKYTGNIIRHEEIKKFSVRPNKQVIEIVIKGLKPYLEISKNNTKRFDDMINSLEYMNAYC